MREKGAAYLGYFYAVDLIFSIWVRLLRINNLLDGDGSKGVFAVLRTISAEFESILEIGHVGTLLPLGVSWLPP